MNYLWCLTIVGSKSCLCAFCYSQYFSFFNVYYYIINEVYIVCYMYINEDNTLFLLIIVYCLHYNYMYFLVHKSNISRFCFHVKVYNKRKSFRFSYNVLHFEYIRKYQLYFSEFRCILLLVYQVV